MYSLPKKGWLVAAALVATSPYLSFADDPSVDVEFSYVAADGQLKSGKTSFAVQPDAVTTNMKTSILVLSAGRTIQTFVRDWKERKENPTLFAEAAPAVAKVEVPEVLGLPLPQPITRTEEDKKEDDKNPRGQRFAGAVRRYKATLNDAVAKLELKRGTALHKQFADLDRDLGSFADTLSKAVDFDTREIRFRGLPTGPRYAPSRMALADGATRGMALTSGGTMSDGPFWEKVRGGVVPDLDQFNLDGFIKRFRLISTTELPEGANNYAMLATGDAYYSVRGERMILKLDTVSTLEESKFVRPSLNVVLALDISGSMGTDDTGAGKNRLSGAKAALVDVIKNLRPDDQVAILAFDHDTRVLLEPVQVKKADKADVIGKIERIETAGATDVSKAQALGYDLLEKMVDSADEKRVNVQNRLILITDAMTNQGEIDNDALTLRANQVASRAKDPIFTTVVGLGRGFNQVLSESLASNPGGTFFYAASGEDLYRLFTHFDTRMVAFATQFSAKVKLNGFPENATIVAVHGSGVSDPKQAIKVGQALAGRRVLSIPTLGFADSPEVDPFSGGGAFFIEVGFKAARSK